MRMLKKLKKTITAVSAAALACSFAPVNALAAEDYTYTVTFYAGNQGDFTSLSGLTPYSQGEAQISLEEDKITVSGLKAGDRITFNAQDGAVSLEDGSRYYIQGLRLSGRDNDGANADALLTVEGDEDYVVAYGIQGDMVAYTVNYLDEDGNELAPGRTYYGNAGDKPVVAYQ